MVNNWLNAKCAHVLVKSVTVSRRPSDCQPSPNGTHPRRLVLVERAENSLFLIEQEIRRSKTEMEIVPYIADITDRERIDQIFAQPRFDKVEAIVSADRLTAVGMGVWQSDGYHPNGDRFDRPGRTTVTLGRKAVGDPFVATHTHMSLFRGTPEQSFGKFG